MFTSASVQVNVRVRTEPYFKVRTERSVRFVFGKNTCSDRTFSQNINFIKNEKWQFIRPITYQNFTLVALKLTEILGKNGPQLFKSSLYCHSFGLGQIGK